ncbi:MAG: hypothetical protein WA823_08060, partial [Candidatus Acidiferrales bacterium]
MRKVRKWVDFVAAVDGESTAAKKEKRHIGAETSGDLDQLCEPRSSTRQPDESNQRGCCVAGTTAETTRDRNFLVKMNCEMAFQVEGAMERLDRANDEVVWPERERRVVASHLGVEAAG